MKVTTSEASPFSIKSMKAALFIGIISLVSTGALSPTWAASPPKARMIEKAQLPPERTPWTFWALHDQLGGFGYSYRTGESFEATSPFAYVRIRRDKKLHVVKEDHLGTTLDEMMEYYKGLTEQDLDKLSPLEKLALVSNRQLIELDLFTIPSKAFFASDWWGNCNGVAMAASLVPEPKLTVRLMSSLGKPINLFPSDVKAIAAYYYDNASLTLQLGHNSEKKEPPSDLRPQDLDQTVRELIKKGQNFFVDVSPTETKWNAPVYAYERKVLNTTSHPGGYREDIQLTLWVAQVSGNELLKSANVESKPLVEKNDPKFTRKIINRYLLDYDKNGALVSGRWHPEYPKARIDYLIVPSSPIQNLDEEGQPLMNAELVERIMRLSTGMKE